MIYQLTNMKPSSISPLCPYSVTHDYYMNTLGTIDAHRFLSEKKNHPYRCKTTVVIMSFYLHVDMIL